MRILLLTSRMPWPPDRGDRLRTYHFLREMRAHHDVHVISLVEGDTEGRGAAHLRELGAGVETVQMPRSASLARAALALPSRYPFQLAYYRSNAMDDLVELRARDQDVVLAHLVRTAPYLERVPRGVRRIVDLCDCISSEYVASLAYRRGLAKMFYRAEARRLARYERSILDHVDEGWVISPAEVEKIGRHPKLRVVPNGVRVPESVAAPRTTGRPLLLFTGNLGVPHNVDAATHLVRDVLPRIRSEVSDISVRLAGANPTIAVTKLAGPGIEVTGWVADLESLVLTADVFVAPMRFVTGVQNKVLEAMACGRAVVTTESVRSGIGAQAGTHLLVGNGAEEIAKHVIRLVRDPGEGRRLGEAAREFVRARFRWNAVLDALEGAGAP